MKHKFISYELYMVTGIIMVFATLIKLLGYADFSSDWFWFIAGIALVLEGFSSLLRQKKFYQDHQITIKKIK